MFLGIITYLDTVKGFKMDYSAFYDIDTITDSMKFPCGLMCSLWCAELPHRPVVLFGFSEEQTRESLRGSSAL